MTDTTNRVLTLKEVLVLPDGVRVYTEERDGTVIESKVRTRRGSMLVAADGMCYDLDYPEWNLGGGGKYVDVRVWSLPQSPTPQELEKNPWEVQDGN